MAGAGEKTTRRSVLIVAAVVFLLTTGGMIAIGMAWAGDLRQPQVVLVGSGHRLSVLVTAGEARLLIATGDDATAFGNGLEQVRHPTTRRLDVLLVAGRGSDLIAPAAIRDDRHVRYAASIGPLASSAAADALGGDILPVLPTPRRIQLDEDVSVVVERVERAAVESGEQSELAWRATVRHGSTTVVIVSEGTAAALFPSVGPVAALVVAGPHVMEAWASVPAPVLVAPGEDTILSGQTLREGAARLFTESHWAIRVHPGEAFALRFVAGGLEVPREPAQAVPGTPGEVNHGA